MPPAFSGGSEAGQVLCREEYAAGRCALSWNWRLVRATPGRIGDWEGARSGARSSATTVEEVFRQVEMAADRCFDGWK